MKPQATTHSLLDEGFLLAASTSTDASLPKKDEYTDSPQLAKPWTHTTWQLQWGSMEDMEDTETFESEEN